MVDIIIPTCKEPETVAHSVADVGTFSPGCKIIVTCLGACAAVNRNAGLNLAGDGHFVIMVDDDISGFFWGWWEELIRPLADQSVVMVSARLMRPDGKPGTMSGCNYEVDPDTVDVLRRELPTACVAFRKDELRFDGEYIGSGFEDTDFCYQLRQKYPAGRFVINNRVRLVHANEQKNQTGEFDAHNRARFNKKWNERR